MLQSRFRVPQAPGEGARRRASVSLLAMLVAVMTCVVGCARPHRKTCGLATTHRNLQRWYAKYEGDPVLLRSTVERQLRSTTALVRQHVARGGMSTTPNLANSRLAYRAARCRMRGGAWFQAARYLYLSLAVRPSGPRTNPGRLSILLALARCLGELRVYQRSALLLMYVRNHLPPSAEKRRRATALLQTLHPKLLRQRYAGRYASQVTAHPLAKHLGLTGARPASDAAFGTRLRQYEKVPRRLRSRVARRLRQGITTMGEDRCAAAARPEERRRIAKLAYEGAAAQTRMRKWRAATHLLYQVLACIPPGDPWAKVRHHTLIALARCHEQLSERRTSLLYYLYVLSRVPGGPKASHLTRRVMESYLVLRRSLGLRGRPALGRGEQPPRSAERCPSPSFR